MSAVDEKKVEGRVAARQVAGELLTLVLSEAALVGDAHGPDAARETLVELFCALKSIMPDVDKEPEQVTPEEEPWVAAVKLADEIQADAAKILQRTDLPDTGRLFLESVSETAANMREGIYCSRRVSLAQQGALQNMSRGVLRWQR